MATAKEGLPVLGIQASCHHARQVAVTCRRGTSLARSLKLLALPQGRAIIQYNNHHHTIYEL